MEIIKRIPIIGKNMGGQHNQKPVGYVLQDVACTLLARDWKGVNNYGFNLVVEICEMKKDMMT